PAVDDRRVGGRGVVVALDARGVDLHRGAPGAVRARHALRAAAEVVHVVLVAEARAEGRHAGVGADGADRVGVAAHVAATAAATFHDGLDVGDTEGEGVAHRRLVGGDLELHVVDG